MSQCKSFAVVWDATPRTGRVDVHRGRLASMALVDGGGAVDGAAFTLDGAPDNTGRLEVAVDEAHLAPGAFATRVSIHIGELEDPKGRSFSFFLRDVSAQTPILVPTHGVAVLAADDQRDYRQAHAAVMGRGLLSEQRRIEAAPEATFEEACAVTRDQMCPVWLGLSRDMRFFIFGHNGGAPWGYLGHVVPRYHSNSQTLPENGHGGGVTFNFTLGRGSACREDITRRLDGGVLPILHALQRDGDIEYEVTAFCSLETQPVTPQNLRGTDYRAGYFNMGGQMLAGKELERAREQWEGPEMREREEETVLFMRVQIVNTADVPRYAFFQGVRCHAGAPAFEQHLDPATGFGVINTSGRVFAIQHLDGRPLPQDEMAVLVPPRQAMTLEFLLPHQPLPPQRAEALARSSFDQHLEAARAFWNSKLDAAAQARVPEPAVDERIRAGLLHCDLVAIGKEPDGPVAATIGWYAPIGSESSPIIQFFDSMGCHDLARRSLQFFLERQRDDGFIQTFGGYQLETGPFLWSLGEHYRYTRDDHWAASVKDKALKSVNFILAWRERNKRDELRHGRGYGLIEGKVADPQDFFHSYMLNGLAYVGVARVAEMLANIDPAESARLANEARAYREDIRADFAAATARSPLIPLGDGTWVPGAPTWSENPGPVSLFAEGGNWFTHGTFAGRDSMLGATYLVLGEVFDAHEPLATAILRQNQELWLLDNAALSQPYYCRHDYLHARRGDVKEFLKTYYTQFAALQDREAYTFWEHYFYASQHKTHEEGWFLMQTRWMLYLESGRTLNLLPLIPRRWMEDGQRIDLKQMRTYFGPFSLEVRSQLGQGKIVATLQLDPVRMPHEVTLRLPHPKGLRARTAEGGIYDPSSESVRFRPTAAEHRVTLSFS